MDAPQSRELADWLVETSPLAAEIVVPWIVERLAPKRVVDVGCGVGSWLAQFAKAGCEIDGFDGYDPGDSLEIDRATFRVVDLAHPPNLPSADLALCLEVGEHLPPSAAPDLVGALATAAPAVMFSAAVPGQRGIGHINEQWPSYWRALFEERGFTQLDVVRRRFWTDDRIPFWYRQNMFVYVRTPDLAARFAVDLAAPTPEDVVHPELFAAAMRLSDPSSHGLRSVLGAIPSSLRRSLRARSGRA